MASNIEQCPPQLNTDVSGIGVRISFYLQTFFLLFLCVRSGNRDDVSSSLLTLIVTNLSMAVTSLALGSSESPQISLQDGIVAFYLLAMSWIAVIFATARYNRFTRSSRILGYLSVFQSVFLLLSAIIFLAKMRSFGSSPNCNTEAVFFIFRPFSALKVGQKIGLIAVVAVLVIFAVATIIDYSGGQSTGRTRDIEEDGDEHSSSWKLAIQSFIILVLWTIAVANTELLIEWSSSNANTSNGGNSGTQWQFGQVLPMLLVVIPAFDLVQSFWENGFTGNPKRHHHHHGGHGNHHSHSPNHHRHHHDGRRAEEGYISANSYHHQNSPMRVGHHHHRIIAVPPAAY